MSGLDFLMYTVATLIALRTLGILMNNHHTKYLNRKRQILQAEFDALTAAEEDDDSEPAGKNATKTKTKSKPEPVRRA